MTREINMYEGWEDEPTARFIRPISLRVLVAEDDKDLRSMMANRLRGDGCVVAEAASGIDALEVLDDAAAFGVPLDLVVMDVRMPGMTGVELGYVIRGRHWTTPILLVTAYPDADLFEEARRIDAQLLAKPFPFTKLSDAARKAVTGGAW